MKTLPIPPSAAPSVASRAPPREAPKARAPVAVKNDVYTADLDTSEGFLEAIARGDHRVASDGTEAGVNIPTRVAALGGMTADAMDHVMADPNATLSKLTNHVRGLIDMQPAENDVKLAVAANQVVYRAISAHASPAITSVAQKQIQELFSSWGWRDAVPLIDVATSHRYTAAGKILSGMTPENYFDTLHKLVTDPGQGQVEGRRWKEADARSNKTLRDSNERMKTAFEKTHVLGKFGPPSALVDEAVASALELFEGKRSAPPIEYAD